MGNPQIETILAVEQCQTHADILECEFDVGHRDDEYPFIVDIEGQDRQTFGCIIECERFLRGAVSGMALQRYRDHKNK